MVFPSDKIDDPSDLVVISFYYLQQKIWKRLGLSITPLRTSLAKITNRGMNKA